MNPVVKMPRKKSKQNKRIKDDQRDAILKWLTREGDKAKVIDWRPECNNILS